MKSKLFLMYSVGLKTANLKKESRLTPLGNVVFNDIKAMVSRTKRTTSCHTTAHAHNQLRRLTVRAIALLFIRVALLNLLSSGLRNI